MQGNLKDMGIADLIQHNCIDGKTSCLTIKSKAGEATLYFADGEIVHAISDNVEGEDVIYQILAWDEGTFQLDAEKKSPKRTINQGWTGLLLEGARRLDEKNQYTPKRCPSCGVLLDLKGKCRNPDCENYAGKDGNTNDKSSTRKKEKGKVAKTKGQILNDALAELLSDSTDIEGAAIVGTDGLVYAADVPIRDINEEMVGAISAAVLNMSRRGVNQLKRGEFTRTMIQGTLGNLIVAEINEETLLVGLTRKSVNLGMAFMEIRTMTEALGELL